MIDVVLAVIRNQSDQILIARRPDHVYQGGLWEFPGGKREHQETATVALCRELREELGIVPGCYRPLIRIPYHYAEKSVLLDVWEVTQWQGKPCGREGQEVCWVDSDHLQDYCFPQANHSIILAAQLPDRYLVTPDIMTNEQTFISDLKAAIRQGIRLIQFRQTKLSPAEFNQLADSVIKLCRQYAVSVLVNASLETAFDLGADGVHLNSRRLEEAIDRQQIPADLLVSASCHNDKELAKAVDAGVDFAVLGNIARTPTHPGYAGKGWEWFAGTVNELPIPVYAIGGLSLKDIAVVRRYGGQGIASIRALWPK